MANHAARRSGSSPVVSMTVVRPRRRRASTIWSSTAKASFDARWSRSCSPTTARSASDDTTCAGAKWRAAHVDFPLPDTPTSTTRHGSGSRR